MKKNVIVKSHKKCTQNICIAFIQRRCLSSAVYVIQMFCVYWESRTFLKIEVHFLKPQEIYHKPVPEDF